MSYENDCERERREEFEFYKRIREENKERYGTDVNRYGPVLLERLYSDRTHFIYELIQNTEDACERSVRSGNKGEFFLLFNLFPDRLEICHNGIPFDEKDVEGICGIVAGTKTEDYSQIGKFGIGFKSVYAYTKSPIIYSKDNTGKSYFFTIKDYVHPHPVDKRADIQDIQTLIVIPFNHNTVTQRQSYQEIRKRIKNLGIRTSLFLNNLQEISWKINDERGRYKRETRTQKKAKWITLSYTDENYKGSNETWLVFDKKIDSIQHNAKVEIAFNIGEEGKKIIPAPYSTLYVYFNTSKETHLNFIVQGPYQTTVGRENIIISDWNKNLVQITSSLLAESLDHVKDLGLLDVSFLETLPIDYEYFTQENNADEMYFNALYKTVKKSLSGSVPYLPKLGGGYITSTKALIGSTEDIRDLLDEKQLIDIYHDEGFNWLDASITRNRTPELRAYLMNELDIREITPEMFARNFSNEFIKKQSDDWVIKFYIFLSNQRALWKPRSMYINDPGVLRSKPIIRLENGEHTQPFDKNGEANVFLPTGGYTLPFPTVKNTIVQNNAAREFLVTLGLEEPDRVSSIKRHILPKYLGSKIEVESKENIEDIKIIINAINSIDSISERRKVIELIKETPLLLAHNCNNETKYKKPLEIYLNQEYTNNQDLETFYSENNNIWWLKNTYLKSIGVQDLKTLGCKDEFQIQYKTPDIQGYVWLARSYSNHQRGLDGFDPNFNLFGIDRVIQTINYPKALLLWKILRKYSHSIYGTIETSTRKDFITASSKKEFSKLGSKLIWNPWIPDKNGEFRKPSEISLSELSDEFSPESSESRNIAEYLNLIRDIETEIIEHLPDEQKEFFSEAFQWTEEEKEIAKKAISAYRFKITQSPDDPEQIQKEFISRLSDTPQFESGDDDDDQIWHRLSPEKEKEVREKLGREIPDRYEKIRLVYEKRSILSYNIIDTIDPKQFLLHEYRGHCQICNTRIDIGKGKDPIFNDFKLIEVRDNNPAANMEFNNLGLCPNCWSRLKYGYSDLSSITDVAKKVFREEIAPESVKERRSDGYLVNISVVGKPCELFYTQTHMQAVSHFLTTDFSRHDET